MKIKIKKLLKESSQGQDLGYTNIEDVRRMNGRMIDRAVLTPSDGIDHFEGEEVYISKQDAQTMTKKDYINRIRDVVKSGRKVPYLYYAYKGVDDNGGLQNLNDLTPVFELQLKKAGMLATRLQHAGDASVLMFLCDFGLLMDHHKEWDKRYEEQMRDLLPKTTYEKMAMKKGYDRAEFQPGRETNLMRFSTVAIGRGSKPIFHQNVDFMYKTSPEPNKNVDPNHVWAFSIRVPLSIAYMILTGMGIPSKPKDMNDIQRQKYRQAKRTAAVERRSITRKKLDDVKNHWAAREKEYRIQYTERMMQEPNSWAIYHELPKLADMIRLNFNQFNSNYVESEREGDKQREKEALKKDYGEHWADQAGPDIRFMTKLIQPGSSATRIQSLISDLENPENAKRIAKRVLAVMINNASDSHKHINRTEGSIILGRDVIQNIASNLQDLANYHRANPTVQKNLPWIDHAIQQYYNMGGK